MRKFRLFSFLMALVILLSILTSCTKSVITSDTEQSETTTETTEIQPQKYINSISIDEFTIVCSRKDFDYSRRAATYIKNQIKLHTGIELEVGFDTEEPYAHEIVVGETSREISKTLNANTQDLEFAIYADNSHIAMEGDRFVIAAAAYFFVETYIADEAADAQIPKEVKVHEPIVKEAKNFIMLIGDGMGVNQTRLFEAYDVATEGDKAYSDGEDIFYGYMLPYQGLSNTKSLSGTTDSAAGGTALATGYKTFNSRVGKDKNYNDIQSLTELAGSMGKATAVLSTDSADGATPASFSSHANSRSDSDVIQASQAELKAKYNTIIGCGNTNYSTLGIMTLEKRMTDALSKMSDNENGFFLMYEEANIDKHCHSSNMESTFNALVRFNQIIGICMEYAFYNPDTFVLITADHETGGLTISDDGTFSYTSTQNSEGSRNHTGAAVPVFAYGLGAEMFNDMTVENVQIPKQIAKLWGIDEFGGPIYSYEYF